MIAGVGAAAWAGAGGGSGQNQEEPRRLVRQAQPRAVAGSGGASSSCAAKDSVDGGAGLWLRTWRPPRPAPSAASTAPASSRDSGSNAHAHAHPGPLRRPPVSRTAQPSQQPPAAASRLAHARRPHPQPSSRPFAPSEPPRETLASLRARLLQGSPRPFPAPANQMGRGAPSPGNTAAAVQRAPSSSPGGYLEPSFRYHNGRPEFRTFAPGRWDARQFPRLFALGSQPPSLPASPRGRDRLGLLAAPDFGTRTPLLWR